MAQRGRPLGWTKDANEARYHRILDVARQATASTSQTVRHIYYLCSGQGIVPKDHGGNRASETVVRRSVGRARWSGDLGWDAIVDGTREIREPSYWNDEQDFLQHVIPAFALDKWEGQPTRVVLCIEKGAIAGMLEGLCQEYHVPLLPFRGDCSDRMVYELAEHINTWKCQEVVCLYMGDYDPSGCVIDRVVFGKLYDYGEDGSRGKLQAILNRFFDCPTMVSYPRLGIVRADLDSGNYDDFILPASPSDRNYRRFMQDNGGDDRTLGIDALDHAELERRAKDAIENYIDWGIWNKQQARYRTQMKRLQKLIQ